MNKNTKDMYNDIQEWIEETTTKEKETHILDYLEYNADLDDENRRVVDNLLFDENNIPRDSLDEEMLQAEFDLDLDFFIDYVNQLQKEHTWDLLTQKQRLELIIKWEKVDAYPYGKSNAKRKLKNLPHYLQKRALSIN
ncbi:MAG: hypothetical protein ACC656_00180 [Candidatus Heimdallarchaeota archaeon]